MPFSFSAFAHELTFSWSVLSFVAITKISFSFTYSLPPMLCILLYPRFICVDVWLRIIVSLFALRLYRNSFLNIWSRDKALDYIFIFFLISYAECMVLCTRSWSKSSLSFVYIFLCFISKFILQDSFIYIHILLTLLSNDIPL